MTHALLLIDIQNDYFPDGAMALEGALEASLQAKKILMHDRKQDALIIHIQHIATRPNATFFLPDTLGVEIHANVRPLKNKSIVVKHFHNSFRETHLLTLLQQHQKNLLSLG